MKCHAASLIFVMVTSMIGGAVSTMCYTCTSYKNMWCADPFVHGSIITPEDCNLKPQSENWYTDDIFNIVINSTDEIFVVTPTPLTVDGEETTQATDAPPPPDPERGAGGTTQTYHLTSSKGRDATLELEPSLSEEWRERRGEAGVMQPRLASTPRVVEPGWKCYRITFKGVRDQLEYFRGCTKETVESEFCESKRSANDKARERIAECAMCDNADPDDNDSPPCNHSWRREVNYPLLFLTIVAVIYSNA